MLVPRYIVLEDFFLWVLNGGQDQQKFTLEVISFDDHIPPSPGIQTLHFTYPHPPSPPDTAGLSSVSCTYCQCRQVCQRQH